MVLMVVVNKEEFGTACVHHKLLIRVLLGWMEARSEAAWRRGSGVPIHERRSNWKAATQASIDSDIMF